MLWPHSAFRKGRMKRGTRMACHPAAALGLAVLALCAMVDDAKAQQAVATPQAGSSAPAKKNIPWDEPGKRAGVPGIDEHSGAKAPPRGGRRADRGRRAPEAPVTGTAEQAPNAQTRAEQPRPSRDAGARAEADGEQRSRTAEEDRAERRRLEEEARAKAEGEARARAEAEAEARARMIAQMRAKALAEEQRRLETEKSRDRFAPRPEPQPGGEPRSASSALAPAAEAAQARASDPVHGGSAEPKPAHEPPASTGSIGAAQQPTPPEADPSGASWTQRVCKLFFFGLGC
jgi:hypothetical protein